MPRPYYSIALSIIAIFGLAAAAWGQAPQTPSPTLSPVFVFDEVVVDLGWQWERFGPYDNPLKDCSAAGFKCLSGDIMQVSVPERCSDVERDVYGSGKEASEVLWRVNSGPSAALGFKERLIGNPSRPYIVYGYRPQQGIIFIIFDALHKTDLVAMARAGKLLETVSKDSPDNPFHWMRRDLMTFKQLFPCQGDF